jgi:hypothetical protein
MLRLVCSALLAAALGANPDAELEAVADLDAKMDELAADERDLAELESRESASPRYLVYHLKALSIFGMGAQMNG